MTKIIGRLREVGIAKESSRGTGVAPTYWIPNVVGSVDDKVVKARTRESYGTIGMDGNVTPVARKWAEGSVEYDMDDTIVGLLLYNLLGSLSTSGPVDSAYTHAFTLANTNQHQSLSLTTKDSTLSSRRYRLAMLNALTITAVPDDTVKIKADFMSKSSQDIATPTTTYSTTSTKFLGRHTKFYIAANTGALGAATNIPLRKLTLTLEKNTVLDHCLSTVQPTDILNQGFRVTGEIELDFQDRTYANYMLNNDYKAVRVMFQNNGATIGAGATNPKLTIDLSRVDFQAWESKFGLDEIANETITFTGLYDLSNTNIVNACSLINGVTSY